MGMTSCTRVRSRRSCSLPAIFEASPSCFYSQLPGRRDTLVSPLLEESRDGFMSTEVLRLADLAHGRSGDKGNHANIAVLAYTPAGYDWLRERLTAEVVGRYFARLGPRQVERYEAANVLGLN